MAANKEAIAIVLDVGPSMNQAPPGEVSSLQTAIDAITMILQRKMFSESKDEVALVLFGTDGTDNPLADGDSYQNITIARPLGVADFDLLQQVKDEIQPSDTAADFLDAVVVAMDHLVQGIQGKRGFASKRIILLSDLGGEFGDDQLDTIIGALHNSGTNIDVIGPNIDDDEDEEGGGGDAGGASVNGHRKEKTPQQRAGEAMIKHILDQVEGECYSFSEALPALSYFTARQVRPTAWKCTMDIGPDLRIPINFYGKIKDFKLKQSWKKVYAKDPDQTVGNLRTQHMNDEEETEVEREDIVQGYRYGNTLVPMSEDDKENMKYKAEKCLKVLGFTKSENVKRHHFLGDGTNVVFAEKGDEAAGVALSAMINALYETNMVIIARRVYSSASGPKLGVLWPSIKANYECLYWAEIPFAEDLRQFTFGSLPIKDDVETNKKYKPTAEQLGAVDDLITAMDLSQATAEDDDEEEKSEFLKPKLTFNPYFQRLYQCLQHRAENTDEGLPELSPLIASYIKPPPEILTKCEEHVEKMKNVFKLELVSKKKDEKTGEAMFKDNEAEAGPAPKRQKLDDNLEGGMQDITRAKVTEVGTVTPTADFQALISRKDEDMFEEACKQMQKRVEQIVSDSFGTQFYGKAMECLKALRQECIKKQEPKVYNDFMTKYKDTLIGKGKRDFWDQIVQDKQALITKLECEDGGVSKEAADKFVEEEVKEEPATPADAETTDDLMDQLE